MPYATNEKRRAAEAKKREARLVANGNAKLCTKCCTMQPVELFRSRGGVNAHLLKSVCNKCLYKEHRNWTEKNQDRVKEYREKDSWTLAKRCARRGITPEELIDTYERQEECCAICKKEIELIDSAIDHNHVTNEFRGVLCKQCNRALGMFRDSEQILENALEYLRMFGSYGGSYK
jgi:hypothetical protein